MLLQCELWYTFFLNHTSNRDKSYTIVVIMLSQKDEQQEMDEKQQGKNACYLKAADEN
jgi:hypothetical protein